MRPKTEARRKRDAKAQAEAALSKTLKKFGLGGRPGPLRGAVSSPLAAEGKRRDPNSPPTSDRIPGSAPASDLLHAHKWKRGAEETTVTTREMIKKASRIAPAYNKGALQYLPSASDGEQWPRRQDTSGTKPRNGRRHSR
jgi:hypothetical protein